MKNKSFFGILGTLAGSGQQENQFSRTFLACFEQSALFRRLMLEELFGLCRIRTRRYMNVEWDCAVEVPTPSAGGGRIDIRLTPAGGENLPVFYLESKLGSPLTSEQLRRYRKHGVDYLVAVTKYSPRAAQTAGIFTLRWQDIHHRLKNAASRSPSDRFLVQSLLTYMEELGMAYREDLTIKDLEACRRALTIVSKDYGEYSPASRNGFEVAGTCFGLLEDVWKGFVDLRPEFARYHRWGPGYFNWTEDDRRVHALGWNLFEGNYNEENLAFRICLPETKTDPLLWTLERRVKGEVITSSNHKAKGMLTRDGIINQESLVRWISSTVKRWKLV